MDTDNFIQTFSRILHRLRLFETSAPLSPDHVRTFDSALSLLFKRRRYAEDQDLWEELYRRSLVFYKNVTSVRDIPIHLVTKHNHIVPWYAQQSNQLGQRTILHFDTHADMNFVRQNEILPQLHREYVDGSATALQSVQNTVWDIGAAISGTMYTTGIRDYVWCMPAWVPDKSVAYSFFMRGKKRVLATNDKRAKRDKTIDLKYTPRPPTSGTHLYMKLQTARRPASVVHKLQHAISPNGNEYILDIDLDYFVCNGKPLKPSYFADPYDVRSHYRTPKSEINEDIPRKKSFPSTSLKRYERNTKRELRFIRKRIRHFLKLVYSLKKKGFVPSHISVCDSTNILFQDCNDCNSISNGYVPTNLALYVHTHLLAGLNKILR